MSQAKTDPPETSPDTHCPCCFYSPCVDVYENENEFLLVADVPGASAEQVSVDLDGPMLNLTAETRNDVGIRSTYRRQLKLSALADVDNVSAEMKNGELTIRLGKADSHRPKRISVQAV